MSPARPVDRGLDLARARDVAAAVTDPELPMLSLADLGVLRGVELETDGRIVVTLTPTYSGCPALATMRADVVRALRDAGFGEVEVRLGLEPAWTSDAITPRGRRTLAEHGISPPGPAPRGPVPLRLDPLSRVEREVLCPRCDSSEVERISEFGSTACKALYRCLACREPFDHFKEI